MTFSVAACIALALASTFPSLVVAGVVRLKHLRDDFTSTPMARCEACVAITHAEVLYIDHIKAHKLAVAGRTSIESADVSTAALCADRFARRRKYGFRIIDGVKRLVGPGLDMFDFMHGEVIDRASVEAQLKTRCDSLMYELEDSDVAETFSDVHADVEANSSTNATQSTKLSQVFMKLMRKNCVELTHECESSEWFMQSAQADVEKLHELRANATLELIRKTTTPDDPEKKVNLTVATAKCNGADAHDSLSDASCRILVNELMNTGRAHIRRWHNLTGEARKYAFMVEDGYETKQDTNDVDGDGDKAELFVEAALNVTYLRANHSMLSAELNFKGVLDIKPEFHSAIHNLAYAYKDSENYTMARDVLSLALEESRADEFDAVTLAESWKLMCEIEYKLGNKESAVDACTKSITLDERNFDVQRLLAQVHTVDFFNELQEIRKMDNATEGIADRQRALVAPLRKAKALFTSALALNSVKNELAHLGMILYFEQAAEDAALLELTKEQVALLAGARRKCTKTGEQLDGACSDILELVGNHLLEMGFIAIGSDALQMSLVFDGTRLHVWRNLGYSYMHTGHFKAANVAFQNAKKLDPAFALDDAVQDLFERGLEFEQKIEDDKVTTKWSEPHRANKRERAELEAQLRATLSLAKVSSTRPARDEL